MLPLAYLDWSESAGKVQQQLLKLHVSREELFMSKLVNATVIRNRMFEHTSHESESNRQHAIYVQPFRDDQMETYGPAVLRQVYDSFDISVYVEPVFFVWRHNGFEARKLGFYTSNTMEIAQLLLDHYLVDDGRTYEVLYTTLDHERKKVLFFLKEAVE